MNRVAFAWIVVFAVVVAVPAVAQSPRIDQLQPNIDPSFNLAIGGSITDQKLAQTVTMGLSGRLQGVYLPVACTPGTTLVLEIHDVEADGSPGPVTLARRRVSANRIPAAFFFKFFRLGRGLSFATGDQFAITIEVEPAFNSLFTCGLNAGPVGYSYTGGQAWFDAADNLPRDWYPTGRDHPFMVVAR